MTKSIIFLGDTHGYWAHSLYPWLTQIGTEKEVIHVGDIGIGFGAKSSAEVFDDTFAEWQNFKMIRGNHDNPHEIKNSSHWVADGTFKDGIMYIGGANSIDKEYRTPGVDWWEEEELSYNDMFVMIDQYAINKPEIVVSHECPEMLMNYFKGMLPIPSRTRSALDCMWYIHKPKLWVFGHFHIDFDMVIEGTRFICVNQYSAVEVEI